MAGGSDDTKFFASVGVQNIDGVVITQDFERYNARLNVEADNQDGYKVIRNHTTTPLALGEIFNTIWDAKELIVNQTIDYLRASITHGGGITPLRRMADFAAMYDIRMAPHGAPDLSPICHAAHAHFNIWAPNFGLQEFIGFGNEKLNSVFSHPLSFNNGYILLEDKPGLGVDYNEEEAAKYTYKRSYLPVSRLEDGTLWYW